MSTRDESTGASADPATGERPLLLRADETARGIDDAPDAPTVEALIRGEQDGTPSVLWAESIAQLDVPVSALVTHVAVPASESDFGRQLFQEALGRFGPARVLQVHGPEEARQAVHTATSPAGRGSPEGGLGRAVRSTLRRIRGLAGR